MYKNTSSDNTPFVFPTALLRSVDASKGSDLYLQIVAAIMAITGIVMMAYADGFHGDSFVGVALAVGSASTSALYKVRQLITLKVEPFVRLSLH